MKIHKRRRGDRDLFNLRRFLVFPVVIIIALAAAGPAVAQVWVGTGYDGVSESYYLAVIDSNLISPDSLEQLRRTASTLHEAELYVRSQVGDGLRWEQTSAVTSRAWQHRSQLEWTSDRQRSARARANYHVDYRRTYDDGDGSRLSSYSIHRAQIDGELRGTVWESRVRGSGEYVLYPDGGGLLYDYWQGRGEWRLSHVRDDFDSESLTLHAARREAVDSTRYSFDEIGATVMLPWQAGGWRFGSSWRITDRRYDERGRTDYGLMRGEVSWRDDGWPARWPGRFEVESYNYYAGDAYLSDYVRVDFEQRLQVGLSQSLTGYVEPGVERYGGDAAEDYWEPRFGVGAEWVDLGGMLATGDVSLARRRYGESADALLGSDYWRLTVDVLVDGPVWGNVTTSVLFTQDWEWHEVSGDDISVALVSVGLRYRL